MSEERIYRIPLTARELLWLSDVLDTAAEDYAAAEAFGAAAVSRRLRRQLSNRSRSEAAGMPYSDEQVREVGA